MIPAAISFPEAAPALAPHPNRMDIALVVGFLPLRAGADALRAARAATLRGWDARVAAQGAELRDLPVRCRTLEEVEALFDTGGRIDRVARVSGAPLPAQVTLTEGNRALVAVVDGAETRVELGAGPHPRAALAALLAGALPGCSVTLGPEIAGHAPLVFTHPAQGAITVYANPDLGFPRAAHDANAKAGAPTGMALRSFFAAGGREAVVVRLGDPVPLMAGGAARAAALGRLLNLPFEPAGLPDVAALSDFPALPPAHPARDPWHGLAHLHGLPEVAMVLLPDLPDLVATSLPLSAAPETLPRPPATFQPCAPDPAPALDGASRPGRPAQTDAAGLALWARIAAWAAGEVARITPEAMLVAALPLCDAGDRPVPDADLITLPGATPGLRHRQLQIVTPWITAPAGADAPGGALPADGMLAGRIAASALSQGAWRSVAGSRLAPGLRPFGARAGVTPATAPDFTLVGHDGIAPAILSDRTTEGAQQGQANIRRLIALILRAARHRGESAVFGANGPAFWRDVAMPVTTLLRQLYSAGALRGAREEQAFRVQCGPDTMSQADIDAGRAIAEVTLAPAHSLEFIEIALTATPGGALTERGAA